ncbi:high-affinity choline transporter 1 [Aplysia californica]|uniref:High-affinity choline transporter 1 n=1 Tax=Aplysia californica TaxID=6500 RepID=A0ABM1W599_APLCA|nr:high-affinity choline transporter 1 [Aplysia californica]
MAVNIPGIVAVVVFYVAILVIGVIAGRKTSKSTSNEAVLVADRSLGMIVSIFTITATMVGGGYINGSAESAASNGLLQTQAPVGYCFALLIAAFTYAPKMRQGGYITMFDPFQLKYGKKVGAILFIPQFLGDLFWAAATLAALGATISIILDMNATLAIILSAAVAIIYTFLGGLYSVAYTDVIQLIFIAVGLVVAFPFALTNSAVDLSRVSDTYVGTVPVYTLGAYIDTALLCVFGGIPWQALYQRVLACKDLRVAKVSTLVASVFSFSLAVPPVIMGIAGSAADWNATGYEGEIPLPPGMWSFILPLTLNYLTPVGVGIVGIGVVAAAVMSSADSCILSASSVFTKNIYADIIRPKSTEKELMWVLRITVLVVGVLGTLIAIFSNTIYGLYLLCSDLMYVVLFPQLTLVLWMENSNAYGSLTGFVVSLSLRLLSGEPVLGLPPLLKYPFFEEGAGIQLFPFRTFAMLMGTICIVVVSLVTNKLFVDEIIPRKYDVLKCYRQRTCKRRYSVTDFYVHGKENGEPMMALNDEKANEAEKL